MNASALKQIVQRWDEVVDLLRALRGLVKTSAGPLCLRELWLAGELGAQLPAFFVYRVRDPLASGQIPVPVAAAYKVLVGLNSSILRFTQINLVDRPSLFSQPVDRDRFMRYLEDERQLIGGKQVCAGPEGLIRRTVDVLVGDSVEPAAAAEDANPPRIDDPRGALDVDALVRFVVSRMNATIIGSLFILIEGALIEDLHRSLCPEVPASDGGTGEFKDLDDDRKAALLEVASRSAITVRDGEPTLLTAGIGAMSRLFGADARLDLQAVGSLVGARLGHDPSFPTTLAVARYLRLEGITAHLSQLLKRRCLSALATEPLPAYHEPILRSFYPPTMRMRHYFASNLGLSVLPNGTVRCAGRQFDYRSEAGRAMVPA